MDDLLDKRPESAVQRFTARPKPADVAGGEGRDISRDHMMLDVQTLTQGRGAFSYHFLTKVRFNVPGDQPDTLRLYFADDLVKIEGRRLEQLYEALMLHIRRHVRELGDVFENVLPEARECIEKITIEEGGQSHDGRRDKESNGR